MNFWKQLLKISHKKELDLRVKCPYCNNKYFWTRPEKISFKKVGAVTARCYFCDELYWIIKRRDRNGCYVRTNYKNKETV